MWDLCLGRLVEITAGQLSLGSLPPLAGDYQPIRRIVFDSQKVQTGDVYWDIETGVDGKSRTTSPAEHALMLGGLGAVVVGRRVEPWAGRFVLYVDDPINRLLELIRCCPVEARPSTFVIGESCRPDLKPSFLEKELFSMATRSYPSRN